MQFHKLAAGARFEYGGRPYRKTGMDVAECDDGAGGMIRREWEVSPIGEPLLLPEAEAEKWKPLDWQTWAEPFSDGAGARLKERLLGR